MTPDGPGPAAAGGAGRVHRRGIAAVTVVALLAATTWTAQVAGWGPFGSSFRFVALDSVGVAVAPDGTRSLIEPGTDVVHLEGSRVAVTDPAAATRAELAAAEEARAWLASGSVPGEGTELEDLATDALLDIHALMLDDGAVVAAWSSPWRYAWPRDNAFVAVALAATGHHEDAVEVLGFLESVQVPDGSFEARYLPDGSGPPDARGLQTDATGWALWSAGVVVSGVADDTERARLAATLRPLVDRSTARALELTAQGTALPPASPDYWEVRERRTTLGTVAPLLMGLEEAAVFYTDLGETALATQASDARDALRLVVQDEFGPEYGRYARTDEADTAVAFLGEPFMEPLLGAHDARDVALSRLAQPAGGFTPGEGWRDDGISWTPTTTVFALSAAARGTQDGDREARDLLAWVDEHRTTMGSIPEKVLHDGSPAQVAPLAWSSANVLLTLVYLED